ncbi:MAG TPA: PilT/PilU family type 4a pilus ATPase [Pseudolysinimonas sp.]|nr:PilT/PilU family type 4a pilus ATPase [Pseudolysinimonas sp.]
MGDESMSTDSRKPAWEIPVVDEGEKLSRFSADGLVGSGLTPGYVPPGQEYVPLTPPAPAPSFENYTPPVDAYTPPVEPVETYASAAEPVETPVFDLDAGMPRPMTLPVTVPPPIPTAAPQFTDNVSSFAPAGGPQLVPPTPMGDPVVVSPAVATAPPAPAPAATPSFAEMPAPSFGEMPPPVGGYAETVAPAYEPTPAPVYEPVTVAAETFSTVPSGAFDSAPSSFIDAPAPSFEVSDDPFPPSSALPGVPFVSTSSLPEAMPAPAAEPVFAPAIVPAPPAPAPHTAPLFEAPDETPDETPEYAADPAPAFEATDAEVPSFEPTPPPAPNPAPSYASAPPPGAVPPPLGGAVPPPPSGGPSSYAAAPSPAAPADAPSSPGAMMRADSVIADGDILSALEQVLFHGASDLHVTANSIPLLRVDGKLRPVSGASVWGPEAVTHAIRSLMTEQQLEVFDETHEMDFAYAIPGGTRFRANCYQQRGATGAAFRIISTNIRSLDELGLPPAVAQFATLPRGLVLVTGPTGSGKSTTLAALIDLVNRTRYDHIVTVEDPIEYVHSNKKSLINQREVGSDTVSFTAALKHVLRQDPDVILIGEMRDLETISVALTAAETGHLVFATLHTQNAAQTIDRIIDVYPSHQQDQIRTQLAATLQGVVSQTLVPRASGAGRTIATEILLTTPAISNLIREGKAHQITSAMQAGRAQGMHTMDQHLADLVNEGEITRESAIEKAQDLDSLERLIRRSDGPAAGTGSLAFDENQFMGNDGPRKH